MRRVRTLALLSLALLGAGAALARPALGQQRSRPVQAHVLLEPERVEVGEPFQVTVLVRHPSSLSVSLVGAEQGLLELDRSWVLFAENGVVTRPDPDLGGSALTTQSLVVASLEPGLRELPPVSVEYTLGGVAHRFSAQPAAIDVAGVLAAEEDAPRPLSGPREVSEPPLEPVAWLARALAALVVLGLAALVVRRLRRSRPESPATPLTPREALARAAAEYAAEDQARDSRDRAAASALHYAITRELRRGVEQRIGAGPAVEVDAGLSQGLTDDEWLERAAPRLERAGSGVATSELRELFSACARVKYGPASPTTFAVQQMLERTERVLETLALDGAEAALRTPARAQAEPRRSGSERGQPAGVESRESEREEARS